MTSRRLAIAPLSALLWALLLAAAPAAADDPAAAYPNFSADVNLQALYVTQDNFRVESGIFGRSLTPQTGNFNSQIGTNENYFNVLETQFRLMLTGRFTEHIASRFTIEVNPSQAREQGFGDPSANVTINNAEVLRLKNYYLEGEHDLGGILGWRIGRQNFDTPHALVVGQADADGLALWWRGAEFGKLRGEAAALDFDGTSEIEDVYAALAYEFPKHPDYHGSLYLSSLSFRDITAGPGNAPPEISLGGTSAIGAWLTGPSTTTAASLSHGHLFWAGGEFCYDEQGLKVDANAVMNFGSLSPGRGSQAQIDNVQGYLAMLDAGYGRSFWRFGAAGAFVTGHDPRPQAKRYTGFLDIKANFDFTRFFFDGGPYLAATGFTSPAVQGSGFFGGKFYAEFTPLDWLAINLQAAALAAQYSRPQFANNLVVPPIPYASVAQDAGRYYGTEVDFWLEFTPVKRLTWLAEVDYFQPGNYFKGPATNEKNPTGFLAKPDPAWRFAGGLLFR
jgi:hypothetical protein